MNVSCNVDSVIETFDSQLNEIDNKCRLCGISDVKNVNIFASTNYEKLLTKIYTVYPIIIYKDDPLPKYICRKCIYNVGFMFNDIQKVLRNQMQWIDDVRSTQPDHGYFKLLELLEQSHEDTRNLIKKSMQQNIDKQIIYRSLLLAELDTEHLKFKSNATILSNIGQELRKTPVPIKENINNFSFDYEDPKSEVVTKTDEESNGFSLKSDYDKSNENSLTAISTQMNDSEDSDVEDDIVLTHLRELPQEPVKCTHCPLTFDNMALLSTHQMTHIQLSLPKIFVKRLLPRELRRGRLITVEERKCIRCLNCWRIFPDNKTILNHWSSAECDYYCQICGMEFAHSPKLLRDHISSEHGISFRALKQQREIMSKQPETTELEPTSNSPTVKLEVANKPGIGPIYTPANSIASKNSIEDVKRIVAAKVVAMNAMTNASNTSQSYASKPFNPNQCPICDQMFQNGKARNSHMRKHKPPTSFAELQMKKKKYSYPSTAGSFQMSSQYKPPPIPTQSPNILQAALLGPAAHSSNKLPPLQPIQRGVRTKFVPPREDPNNVLPGPSSIKVRSLNDLKTNSTHSFSPIRTASNSPLLSPATCVEATIAESIKSEPIFDDATNSAFEYSDPSPLVTARYTPTLESFKAEPMEMDEQNAEEDEDDDDDYIDSAASSLATCDFCGQCFLYEDDLNLHKAQVHHASI